MKVQSKCKECGEWSDSNGNLEDRCNHCGELFNKQQFSNRNKALTERLIDKQTALLIIRDEDNALVKFLKRIGLAIQFVFVAFASFVIWLVTLLAG